MSPYDGLPQAAFSSPVSRREHFQPLPLRERTWHFTTFPSRLCSPGPPDHFEFLLLVEHCARFGFGYGRNSCYSLSRTKTEPSILTLV